MKIYAINTLKPQTIQQNINNLKAQNNNENLPKIEHTQPDNYRNYILPFTGEGKKNNLPQKLKVNPITECNPVNDGDNSKDSEKLSGVLSTALKYLTPETPVILASSNRYQSMEFLTSVFSDKEFFDDKDIIDNVIFVEDDRIDDDPVLFIKNKNNDIFVIGDIIIEKKDKNNKIIISKEFMMPIDIKEENIRFENTEISPISLDETPNRRDLQHIKMFKAEEVMNNKFPATGNIYVGGFSTDISEQAKYNATNYPMFSDIGGNKEAIQKVIENIYAPIVFPEAFGHVMTKGTILEGPPGTGKSMLGLALCNELSKRLGKSVHLQAISGAEMQVSAVGGSEEKWRELFEEAINNQPALILIDEIDACTPTRDGSSNARYDNSVVNQILSLMSNLEKSDHQVHVIGMTNRVSAIDPAMLRNGRFGIINVPAFDKLDEAKEIYDKVSSKYNIEETVDTEAFLKRIIRMKGTGATIAGALENAKKYSLRRNNIYTNILTENIAKSKVDACKINTDDLNKALDEEEMKQKKAKIQPDRIVIKGFSK